MLDKVISLMGVVGWLAYLVAVQYGMVVEMPYCIAALVTFVLPMRMTYVFWVANPEDIGFFFFSLGIWDLVW